MDTRKEIQATGKMAGKTSGFTLVEVLVAMAVFAFGALAIVSLSGTISKGNADARRIGDATRLVRELAEELDMFRTLYAPVGAICDSKDISLTNSTGTKVFTPIEDPESRNAGESDILCPVTEHDETPYATEAQFETLLNDQDVTDATLLNNVFDHYLRDDSGNIAPVDPFYEFGTDQSIYYVVWNVKAGYPHREIDVPTGKQKNTTVTIYCFWRGMDQKRHWVSTRFVATAKNAKFYF